ncbi:DUF3429 domain-containing protein [Phenylobacterium sp.]|uniref:DUF3429 domain-containing protein n=1 Tax=Phenylobacterium sp. TaxID=1871053 RepID=UPI0035AFF5C9
MQSAGRAPPPLWIIALLALSPFPVAALTYAYGPAARAPLALMVILTWSAVVLAFLGGVRWGLETGREAPRWRRLVVSVISPVTAWILFLGREAIPDSWELIGYLAAFLLQWLFDHSAPDVPARWPRLMTTLTLGACVSLAMVLEKVLRM